LVIVTVTLNVPIPVAKRSKARVFWDFGFEISQGYEYLSLVSVVCCQVQLSVTDDPSSTEVLPTAVRHFVCSRNLKNEATLASVGLLS
jgi:hypothetical protein